MEQNKLQSAVEAILFALGVPVETGRLCQALETDRETVEAACRALAESYEARDAGIRLACLEDSWQLTSSAEWGEVIRTLLSRRKPDKLSPAALETLTVVAYFQPVTRVYIDQVRGVDSAHSVALLLDRELIAPCGSLDAPGRPILYRTTPAFLRSFGLSSLDELPPLPEKEPPSEDGEGEGGDAM